MKHLLWLVALLGTTAALAKLPAPNLTDEEKAKAAEARAKTAHAAKVDAYKTCLASERAAAHYFKSKPSATKPASAPACTDPGPFVMAPPAAPAAAAAPAAPAKDAKKS